MSSAPRKVSRQSVRTDAGLADLPLLNITAPLDYAIVPATYQNLMCGHGKVGDRVVLTPYINFRMNRSLNTSAQSVEELETEEAFSGSLSYENMAFLIMDLSRDFRGIVSRLAVFSSGSLNPEPVRLHYAAHCLAQARDALDAAITDLQSLAEQSEADERAVAKSKPKPSAKAASKLTTKAAPQKATRAAL